MNDIRKKELEAIDECLKKYPLMQYFNDAKLSSVVRKLERSCQNAAISIAKYRNIPIYWNNVIFVEQYHIICYKLKANLDITSSIHNIYFINGIFNYLQMPILQQYVTNSSLTKFIQSNVENNIPISDKIVTTIMHYINKIAIIDPTKVGYMSSEELAPHKTKHIQQQIEKRANQKIKLRVSKMYKCFRCGKRSTTSKEKQTRSLDEPATLFITCTYCGNNWKQG